MLYEHLLFLVPYRQGQKISSCSFAITAVTVFCLGKDRCEECLDVISFSDMLSVNHTRNTPWPYKLPPTARLHGYE